MRIQRFLLLVIVVIATPFIQTCVEVDTETRKMDWNCHNINQEDSNHLKQHQKLFVREKGGFST